jgi:sugar phosphate isomerase/epimerase
MYSNRRNFIKHLSQITLGSGMVLSVPTFLAACGQSDKGKSSDDKQQTDTSATASTSTAPKLFFEISLAQWSLNKALFAKELDNLDFPVKAKKDFGIDIVEYVNQFFPDKAKDNNYLRELKKRADDNGVRNHLIMIDNEGQLGDLDKAKRAKAIENHYKWVDAAKYLGCRTIRVNAAGEGPADEVMKAAIDGLSRLTEFGEKQDINVIVENHGGYSSNGKWLAAVMKGVNKEHCGTLPDFGNFCIKRAEGENHDACAEEYDRYQGTEELMPFAKGVSAKTFDFNDEGNESSIDYSRLLAIIKKADFTGIIGVEYEGKRLSADEGIRKTKALLERVGASLA